MNTKKSISVQRHPDLDAVHAKVLRRREYLELLETELTNTRAIIQEFAQVYNARIAPLEKEQSRLSQLLKQMTADLAPPSSGWQGRTQRSQRQAAADAQTESEPLPKKKVVSKDPDYERKVRDLFRRLAKQYHPDLAQEAEDKKQFEQIMAEINQAYMAKDLKTLEGLAQTHGFSQNGHSQLPAAEMTRLSLELRQLEAMIFEIEQTIRELDLSPAMQMRGDIKDERPGRRDVIREMEADYRSRISDLQEQLIALGAEIDLDV